MREAVFSNSFYPAERAEILSFLKDVTSPVAPEPSRGAILPHAGYIYSGKTAFKTLASTIVPDTVLLLCPNHRGLGIPLSVSPDDAWDTPLGPLMVDNDLASEIAAYSDAGFDSDAHRLEHALEVQLPFVKLLNPKARIVAVSVGTGRRETLRGFAEHISGKIDPDKVLIVASSDMSHYVSAQEARNQDQLVIDKITAMDAEGMIDVVCENRISMCGAYPAYVMMHACIANGATRADVIEYTHSGVVTGSDRDVVAYLGVRIC